MDIGSLLISTLLFAALVPGVLVKLPPRGSPMVVLVTHAVLFAVLASLIMSYYWTGRIEFFANYGASCPNGYVPGTSPTGAPDCVPIGRATYPGTAK